MRDEADDPGLLPSSVTMLRLLVAWSFTAIGLLDLAMGIDGLPYLIFHVVLLGAGLVLLALGLLEKRPRLPAYLTGIGVAAAGLLISSLPAGSAAVCCRPDAADRHGYPFTLLADGRLDAGRAVSDLLFWANLGLLALLAVTVLTRAHRPAHDHPAGRHAHAEQRAEIADDENVGGLP
jgi:hypothetical protein